MKKYTEKSAGYMELLGAEKDADCQIVEVKGGISKQLGCCNHFEPKPEVKQFRCGNCEYLVNTRRNMIIKALRG